MSGNLTSPAHKAANPSGGPIVPVQFILKSCRKRRRAPKLLLSTNNFEHPGSVMSHHNPYKVCASVHDQ